MRLIDADELMDLLRVRKNSGIGTEIEEIQTVKAIPVDWIEKQKVDFQNEDHPFNYCRGFQDGFNDCIDYLLSEWAEENEDIRG